MTVDWGVEMEADSQISNRVGLKERPSEREVRSKATRIAL